MRVTHTFVRLPLSKTAHEEIARKLAEAGYEQAFQRESDGSLVIDMHGIAVVADGDKKDTEG